MYIFHISRVYLSRIFSCTYINTFVYSLIIFIQFRYISYIPVIHAKSQQVDGLKLRPYLSDIRYPDSVMDPRVILRENMKILDREHANEYSYCTKSKSTCIIT